MSKNKTEKKSTKAPKAPKIPDMSAQMAKAAQLDLKIKALQAELDPIKAEIKETFVTHYAGSPDGVYPIDGGYQLKVTTVRTLNKALALQKYGELVTERVVTPVAVKKALTTEQWAELYEAQAPSLTFTFVGI